MATEAKQTKETALAHLAKLEKEALAKSGKPGYNPYLFLNQQLYPLRVAVENGDGGEATLAKAHALQLKIVVDPAKAAASDEADEAAEKQAKAEAAKAAQKVK